MRHLTDTKAQFNKLFTTPIYLYLIVYSAISYATLLLFPTVHSDETWLMGLSNDMIKNKSLFVTESFFDLMPRTVHTIKSFFHLLQILYINLFGYSVSSIRLLSLCAAIICLYFFYQLLLRQNISEIRSLIYTIFLSLNIQFIYASHFGRQEIIMFLLLTCSLYVYSKETTNFSKIILLALILGLSIGFHPNAFIITCMIGILLLKDTFKKTIPISWLLTFTLIIGIFAIFLIAISLINNPNFFTEYFAYGSTLGVNQAPIGRFENLLDYYIKLFEQISGTYYIPPMKVFFILGGLMMIVSLVFPIVNLLFSKSSYKNTHKQTQIKLMNKLLDLSLMLIAFNVAIFIIGRYNTTSIIFACLPIFLMIIYTIEAFLKTTSLQLPHFKNQFAIIIFILIILGSIWQLIEEYDKFSAADYHDYLSEIQQYISSDSIILGNLSSGTVFKNNEFYDIRNLTFIGSDPHSSDQTLEDYIDNRHINTIIYYEEYDYIHRNPQWDILYGNDHVYYDDLQNFLNEKTTLVHTFDDMYYGSRLIRYMGDYPWKVYVYTIN